MMSALRESIWSFGLSAVGVGLTFLYTRRIGLVDAPNHRSSHSIPTPRGGGLAIVGSVLVVGAYMLAELDPRRRSVLAFVAAALAALAVVGWLDDKGSMRVGLRLPVHLLCGFAIGIMVNVIHPLPGSINILWLVWWIFWTTASINIVNFMDGIDGMIACQGIVYGVFLFAILPPDLVGSRFGLILAAACLGFLLWNWAPAKIFMGDVGSGPLGLLFVVGGALALEGAPAALVFLPLFPLFLDALLTLTVRFLRGEKLTTAHRQHLYQRIANVGPGHAMVSLAYALAAAGGALVAASVKEASAALMGFAIGVYLLVIIAAWMMADAWSLQRPPKTVA